MPDTGFLLLSAIAVTTAVLFVLFPNPLLKLSAGLNRTLTVLDGQLMRHRYLVAVLLFAASYLLFKAAFLVPHLGV